MEKWRELIKNWISFEVSVRNVEAQSEVERKVKLLMLTYPYHLSSVKNIFHRLLEPCYLSLRSKFNIVVRRSFSVT